MWNRTKLDQWCDSVLEAGWLAALVVAPLFFNVFSSRVFEPDMDASHREHLLEQWSLAVGKSRGWALGDVE